MLVPLNPKRLYGVTGDLWPDLAMRHRAIAVNRRSVADRGSQTATKDHGPTLSSLPTTRRNPPASGPVQFKNTGADDQIRTGDLLFTKQLLYH